MERTRLHFYRQWLGNYRQIEMSSVDGCPVQCFTEVNSRNYLLDKWVVTAVCLCKAVGPICHAKHFESILSIIIKSTIYTERDSTRAKWSEWGFRPLLCTCRLNWVKRTSWGWGDKWDDNALQTQDSKFEPWRSEAELASSQCTLECDGNIASGCGGGDCVSALSLYSSYKLAKLWVSCTDYHCLKLSCVKHRHLIQQWFNVGPTSSPLSQH